MTVEEYNKLLTEYELVSELIEKADEYGLEHSHPLVQYLFQKHLSHPDSIISMENRFNTYLSEDMLKHSKPANLPLYRIFKTKTEIGYIDIRATSIKEALALSAFKTKFYIPIAETATYITNYDRTGIHNSPLSS